jgi:hypothetical protein
MAIDLLAAAYLAISLLHVFWAMGGRFGAAAAIPSRDGRLVFQPGRAATLCVGVMIAGCSAMLCAWTGVLPLRLPHVALRGAVGFLGLVMFARAVGDFRYVGLFRAVRESAFARMDRWVYTPFSIAAGVLLVTSAFVGA